MAVRIRMKRLGRKRRPFFRICAMDARAPRDGKVIEELGHYDPMVRETDARAILKKDRVDYWLSVGAQPSEKVAVLIKKYGSRGTRLEAQQAALERLHVRLPTPEPVAVPLPDQEASAAEEAPAEPGASATAEEEGASGEAGGTEGGATES